MLNAVVGVLIVNVIGNGMVVIGLPNYLQDGLLGVLVIFGLSIQPFKLSTYIEHLEILIEGVKSTLGSIPPLSGRRPKSKSIQCTTDESDCEESQRL